MDILDKILPSQEEGWQTSTSEKVEEENIELARRLYETAKARLRDVNHWHLLDDTMPAQFFIVDENGNEQDGKIKEDNYIKIKLIAPGTDTGTGYDWVQVERVDEITDDENNSQVAFMIVHPCANPLTEDDGSTAHFFTEAASGCFVVQQENKTVTASVFGRNEKPNTQTNDMLDNARNVLVAIASFAGFAKSQWKILVKALLN